MEALTTSEASDTQLTDAIVRLGKRFDRYVNDRFEPEVLTLEIAGSGDDRLYVPRRIRAITQIETRSSAGEVYAVHAATGWREVSSLTGDGLSLLGDVDYILLTTPLGTELEWSWPSGPRTVRIQGTFGWQSPPEDVKRAVAIMVWDHFKPQSADLRRARTWRTDDAFYDRATTLPTGIPEVDDIVELFRRPESSFAAVEMT